MISITGWSGKIGNTIAFLSAHDDCCCYSAALKMKKKSSKSCACIALGFEGPIESADADACNFLGTAMHEA